MPSHFTVVAIAVVQGVSMLNPESICEIIWFTITLDHSSIVMDLLVRLEDMTIIEQHRKLMLSN